MRRIRARITDQQGFTLIEVLVVASIIPILAGIAIPSFLGQREKAKDPQAKSAVRNAASAIELLHAETGTYAGAVTAALKEIEPSLNEVARRELDGHAERRRRLHPGGQAGRDRKRVRHHEDERSHHPHVHGRGQSRLSFERHLVNASGGTSSSMTGATLLYAPPE